MWFSTTLRGDAMKMTLNEMIQDASSRAAWTLKYTGAVPITFIGYRPDGNPGFMFDQRTLTDIGFSGADNKNFLNFLVQQYVHLFGCTQVVHISEAWVKFMKHKDGLEIPDYIHDDPERHEIMMYMAEDIDGNRFQGQQSIIRPSGGEVHLADDLKINDASDQADWSGRFMNFWGGPSGKERFGDLMKKWNVVMRKVNET